MENGGVLTQIDPRGDPEGGLVLGDKNFTATVNFRTVDVLSQ